MVKWDISTRPRYIVRIPHTKYVSPVLMSVVPNLHPRRPVEGHIQGHRDNQTTLTSICCQFLLLTRKEEEPRTYMVVTKYVSSSWGFFLECKPIRNYVKGHSGHIHSRQGTFRDCCILHPVYNNHDNLNLHEPYEHNVLLFKLSLKSLELKLKIQTKQNCIRSRLSLKANILLNE